MLIYLYVFLIDMRLFFCVDEKDEYYCLYEIVIEELCDFKLFVMMKECRFLCSFCSKWKKYNIFIFLKFLFVKSFVLKFNLLFIFVLYYNIFDNIFVEID